MRHFGPPLACALLLCFVHTILASVPPVAPRNSSSTADVRVHATHGNRRVDREHHHVAKARRTFLRGGDGVEGGVGPRTAPRLSDAKVSSLYAAMSSLPRRTPLRMQATKQARPNNILRRLLEIIEPSPYDPDALPPPTPLPGTPAAVPQPPTPLPGTPADVPQPPTPLPGTPAAVPQSPTPLPATPTVTLRPPTKLPGTPSTTPSTTPASPVPTKPARPDTSRPSIKPPSVTPVDPPHASLRDPAVASTLFGTDGQLKEALAAVLQTGATNEQADLELIREALKGTTLMQYAQRELMQHAGVLTHEWAYGDQSADLEVSTEDPEPPCNRNTSATDTDALCGEYEDEYPTPPPLEYKWHVGDDAVVLPAGWGDKVPGLLAPGSPVPVSDSDPAGAPPVVDEWDPTGDLLVDEWPSVGRLLAPDVLLPDKLFPPTTPE